MTGVSWYERHFLLVDAVAGLALGGVAYYALGDPQFGAICTKLLKNRHDLYATLAGIFGSLLGFAITALTIVLSTIDSRKLRGVRESDVYPVIWQTMKGSVRTLGFGTMTAIIALIVDQGETPQRFVVAIVICSAFLATMRLVRAIWIVERLVGILTIDPSHRPPDIAAPATRVQQ